MMDKVVVLLLSALFIALPHDGFAQSGGYPSRPIRIVAGYAAGGSADVSARIVADALRQALGQNVVVENQPGAAGNIAAQAVSRAAPDGYTLLLGNTGEMSVNKFLIKDMGFDPDADFAPIALAYNITHVVAVPAKSPYKTLGDFLADARANPGKVKYASAGIGTPGHLAGETLALKTRTTLVHVPYKGGGQAVADLIGGHIDSHFSALPTAVTHVKSGAVRLLAVTAAKRVATAPDVPTVAEAGIAGVDFPLWGGLFAPVKTPREIVMLLNREVNKAYDRPDVQTRIAALHSEVIKYTPEQFAEFLKADSDRYREITKALGMARK
jgi:tripartite-type tricarboxylate transporter receptor subunit TctC